LIFNTVAPSLMGLMMTDRGLKQTQSGYNRAYPVVSQARYQ